MARTKGASRRQLGIIKSMSRRGYTANQINRTLRTKHVGMRRTKLLGYVREFKNRPARSHVERYTRIRYRHAPSIQINLQKRIILKGRWKGKTKEIEQRDSGGRLKDFVMREMSKARHGDGWDARPQVISE
jgi:hypothetical protein